MSRVAATSFMMTVASVTEAPETVVIQAPRLSWTAEEWKAAKQRTGMPPTRIVDSVHGEGVAVPTDIYIRGAHSASGELLGMSLYVDPAYGPPAPGTYQRTDRFIQFPDEPVAPVAEYVKVK